MAISQRLAGVCRDDSSPPIIRFAYQGCLENFKKPIIVICHRSCSSNLLEDPFLFIRRFSVLSRSRKTKRERKNRKVRIFETREREGGIKKNESVVSESLILHASRFQFRVAARLGNFFARITLSLPWLPGDRCPTNSSIISLVSSLFNADSE